MEYYYCPSLLKLLQYLWVSLADRTRVLSPANFASWLRLAGSASVFFRNGGCFKEGGGRGSVWEAEGLVKEERVLPAMIGGHRGCPSSPRQKKKKKQEKLTTFPESNISLIYEMVLYSEITSLPLLCACKIVSSFMRQKE